MVPEIVRFQTEIIKIDASKCIYGAFLRGDKMCPITTLATNHGFEIVRPVGKREICRIISFVANEFKAPKNVIWNLANKWDRLNRMKTRHAKKTILGQALCFTLSMWYSLHYSNVRSNS